MGKSKNCDPGLRNCILNLYDREWSYKKIADHLKCSKTMVFNAVKHYKQHGTVDNIKRKQKPRKTTHRTDARIIRLARKYPRLGSEEIKRWIFGESSSGLSARSIRRRLDEAQLFGRVARKKPLVSKRNRDMRIRFAKMHRAWTLNQWKNILWSDETKINRLGSDGRQYVRRPPRAEFNPKYTEITLKHGGGSILLWGCFSWHGVGPIHRIQGIMDQNGYKNILENVMLPFAEENLSVLWKFQQDNDPKHRARSVQS